MRMVVLGAGALGSLIGGYLARAGAEVTLIGRPAHMQAIRERGLKISGVRGEVTVGERLRAVTSPEEVEGEFDWLVLAVKGKDTASALAGAERLRERVAAAFSVQNSVTKDDELIAWFGDPRRVIGFATIEGATLVEPGHVRNHVTVPTTAYAGELGGEITPRVEALVAWFNQAGLGAKAVANIRQVEWEKLAQICLASGYSVSCLAAVPHLGFADGLVVREGAEHYVALAKEIMQVYRALGYAPQNYFAPLSHLRELEEFPFDEAVEFARSVGERLRERGSVGRTSMHEDILRGRRPEVDAIFAPFVREADRLGLEVPVLRSIYRTARVWAAYLS
ncbi:ketopantoate reductase [Hydrogenibacillus schlegelii]|uniref:2-dehydropantoate 2-reductase n=2 Tax=Hydrogenibacillus schlegelii TaxID=1484 RepID=A0A132MGQ1_HYDSH|nr:ketopantoate reductase [Hydrogenibacillus schlegelii]OAR05184.1 ketopantoate reductase [Hydrogenibacillus schlegelii]QZA33820.1 ketopantoate reductase family protein [Hydrogenibacillus sp. N12]